MPPSRIKSLIMCTLALLCLAGSVQPARALSISSFDLDSIAAWGKFPRFCINVYRWGDGFFNGYDTAYVQGTGCKFNAKWRTDSWLDAYNFSLDNGVRMGMRSNPSTATGLWLTYMAVTVGYDINVSKLFGGNSGSRKRFNFGFTCSLFSVNLEKVTNDIGLTMTHFGPKGDYRPTHVRFDGVKHSLFSVEGYYFFRHKKYSQAAALGYSRLQKRSKGSFFLGFLYNESKYSFDFRSLPPNMTALMPEPWVDEGYHINVQNYCLKFGYGFNWVLGRWLVAVSEAPIFGIKRDRNVVRHNISTALTNDLIVSGVLNYKRWFFGGRFRLKTALFFDSGHSLVTNTFNFETSVGYRFNLW